MLRLAVVTVTERLSFFRTFRPPGKAEGGAPQFLARLRHASCTIAGDDSRLSAVACLALDLLFALER